MTANASVPAIPMYAKHSGRKRIEQPCEEASLASVEHV
jgi:hypothetical protein